MLQTIPMSICCASSGLAKAWRSIEKSSTETFPPKKNHVCCKEICIALIYGFVDGRIVHCKGDFPNVQTVKRGLFSLKITREVDFSHKAVRWTFSVVSSPMKKSWDGITDKPVRPLTVLGSDSPVFFLSRKRTAGVEEECGGCLFYFVIMITSQLFFCIYFKWFI